MEDYRTFPPNTAPLCFPCTHCERWVVDMQNSCVRRPWHAQVQNLHAMKPAASVATG